MIKLERYDLQKNDPELIVLLDEKGIPIGSAPKLASHNSITPLHLAFSTYIFNQAGELLATRRADSKKVWNGVWTNSCCGHPAPNESVEDAVKRRVKYELGMSLTNLSLVVPDYRYKTPPFKGVVENEVCPIYFALSVSTPQPCSDEVAEYEWLSWSTYTKLITKDASSSWSWWCKDQLKYLVDIPEVATFTARQPVH